MTYNPHQQTKRLAINSKKLFLIDGLGALLSAFLLGVVLVKYEVHFGIPLSALYFLAVLPLFFAVFDFYCYRSKSGDSIRLLRAIAFVNLAYCSLSLALAIYHSASITYLGWTYILVEIVLVAVLALIELKAAKILRA